jgi:hypothetical protein
VIGLLVTGDDIPIVHHIFSGNTPDGSTLTAVMDDLKERFGVGRIALVADRGLISEDNLEEVAAHGFDHVLATKLHRDARVEAVLEEANGTGIHWLPVAESNSFCAEITHDNKRFVVVFSPVRYLRDKVRHFQLCARMEGASSASGDRDSLATLRARCPAPRYPLRRRTANSARCVYVTPAERWS